MQLSTQRENKIPLVIVTHYDKRKKWKEIEAPFFVDIFFKLSTNEQTGCCKKNAIKMNVLMSEKNKFTSIATF